jgi:hypothetical protein
MSIPAELSAYYWVFGLGMALMQLNLISSVWVICAILMRRTPGEPLQMYVKFPLYIAVTDILLYLSLMGNQMHTVVYKVTWQGLPCKFFSSFVFMAGTFNMILVLSLSLTTYLSFCKGIQVDFGKKDWKLWALVLSCGFFVAGIGFSSAGPSRYWCYSDNANPNKTLPIITACLEVVVFCLTLYFFSRTVHEIRQKVVPVFNRSQTKTSAKLADIRKKAARKMMTYVFNFLIQWFPTLPYCLGTALNYFPDWIYICATIFMNLGGVLNLVSYYRNETHRRSDYSTYDLSRA